MRTSGRTIGPFAPWMQNLDGADRPFSSHLTTKYHRGDQEPFGCNRSAADCHPLARLDILCGTGNNPIFIAVIVTIHMSNHCSKCGKVFPFGQNWCNWCDQGTNNVVVHPGIDKMDSVEPGAVGNSSKPLGLGVWILLTGVLLGLLTLFLFGITAFTGNVLFGYTAIAACIYVLPIALILFVVGLAMSIVSPQPDAKNHQTIDVCAGADNQKSE